MPVTRSTAGECFSKAEVAELLDVHPQTVVKYSRERGLVPRGGSRPRTGNEYTVAVVARFVGKHFEGLEPELVRALGAKGASPAKVMKACRKVREASAEKGGAA